ncbi:MAG: NUDIX hydrolase [Candidatus Methanomethylicia archaeon]
MKYPTNPEVGVGVVVIDESNRILLVKRKYPPGAGKWSIPGGHLELGESLYEAAIRELYEETGINGDPIGIVNIDELVVYDDKKRIKYHYVLIDVLVKPKTPIENAKASSDVLEIAVIPIREAVNLDITKTSRSLIEKLISKGGILLRSNFITYSEY